MRNWFIGVLSGIVFVVLFGILVVALAMKFAGGPPRVQAGTTLVLDLDGEVAEHHPTHLVARLMEPSAKPTLRELVESIDKAAADRRITALVVRPRSSRMGWAKTEDLRAAFGRFRKSGKKLYCHLIQSSLREYYLATACEKIFMQPVGLLDIKGMRAEAMFWKGTLDKLGAQPQIVNTGDYKTYKNVFTETAFTEPHREMVTWLLDSLYGQVIKGIGEARGKDLVTARSLIESGPFESAQAQAAGLVDQLLYEDEVYDLIKNQDPDKRFRRVSVNRYVEVPREDAGIRGGQKVGIIYAVGTILQGDDSVDPLSGEPSVGADTAARLLRQARDDNSLKAVILRVDSPGGDALASDSIWREVGNLLKKKPVVISMSDVAASGGYYIASTGAPIVAARGTITGSIGVVYGKINIRGLYEKLGISKDMVTRGPYALLDSEYHSYTPDEARRIQKLADDMYQEFVRKVAAARKTTVEKVDAMARGRVFTGEQAKEKGLVDDVGGLERAIEVAKEKAGIPRTESVQLVPFPRPRSLFELILERGQSTEWAAPAWQPARVPDPLRELLALRFLNSGRPLAIMPFRLEFR